MEAGNQTNEDHAEPIVEIIINIEGFEERIALDPASDDRLVRVRPRFQLHGGVAHLRKPGRLRYGCHEKDGERQTSGIRHRAPLLSPSVQIKNMQL